ncbi:carboxypeptidase regulatory-like domain-containing protein [Acidobacteriota bacterium]
MSIKRISIVLVLTIVLATMAGIPAKPQFRIQNQKENLIAGRNVNMVSGITLPGGDPWLQRQNEPSLAVSTRNPLHLLAGANDYRTVDVPFSEGELPGQNLINATGDAWLGVYKSFDGGQSWTSTLLPGYPQDLGSTSPLHLGQYQAAADPVVRSGPQGMFYYSGIVFDRGDTGKSAVFISRFIDNNNDEEFDSIKYLGTTIIDDIEGEGRFKDKPWIAVDVPKNNSGTVNINGQEILRHNVYIVYSVFTGPREDPDSTMIFRRSTDCGLTWEDPIEIQNDNLLNQGATIAINPTENGHIYVAWRRFFAVEKKDTQSSAIVVARSTNQGKKFSKAYVVAENLAPFDQITTPYSFRTNSYPTIAIDDKSIIYVAWSQRGVDPLNPLDSRVVVATSRDGVIWTTPQPIEESIPNPKEPGGFLDCHQFMPSMVFASGKLMLVWYDTRNSFGNGTIGAISDDGNIRHTIDVRVAQAISGDYPTFYSSVQATRYLGSLLELENGSQIIWQVQFNPPNYPLFQGGLAAFHSDYIDIAPSPTFIQDKQGYWNFNTDYSNTAVFHIAWVDNRDVRPPQSINGQPPDWTTYNPPSSFQPGFGSQECETVNPDTTGMRNQNIYTSRITSPVEIGTPGNSKPLGTLGTHPETGELIPRAFVLFVKNTTENLKSFRLKIADSPALGQASFLEHEILHELDVDIAPFSTISRPVFVTSSDAEDTVTIEVMEIDFVGGTEVPGGLFSSLVLNSDDTNPEITGDLQTEEIHNPNIFNPNIFNWSELDWDKDILNPNIFNPNIFNPNIFNPNIFNPDIVNPNIFNPNIFNPNIFNNDIANPNIFNPNIFNPNIFNPNIFNPNIFNPNIFNPNIFNTTLDDASVIDVEWKVVNEGNTASSYTFKVFARNSLPEGIYSQLLIYKAHYTPSSDPNAADDPCALKQTPHHELLLNISNPNIFNINIVNPNIFNPNIFNSAVENATFHLSPGEEAYVILRMIEEDPSQVKTLSSGKTFKVQSFAQNLGASATSQAVDTEESLQGEDVPEVDTTELMILSSDLAPAIVGEYYSDTLLASGGDDIYMWSLNPNKLPPGLTYTTDGVISGTPIEDMVITYPHIYSFLVQVASDGATNTQNVSITVNAADDPTPPLDIHTTALDPGTKGDYYGATLQAAGGEPPYNWGIFSGSLPPGLTIDSGGIISGTILHDPSVPDYPYFYDFTVIVTDSVGSTDTQILSLNVQEFTQPDVIISGYITDGNGNPVPEVIVYGLNGAPMTDSGGYYETYVPYGFSGTAEPFKAGFTFSPSYIDYDQIIINQIYQNYTANGLSYTLSGTVALNGIPLSGVVMNGLFGAPETNTEGYYEATVSHNWTGTVTPALEGFDFDPSSRNYTGVVTPLYNQDYEASYEGGEADDIMEDNDDFSNAWPIEQNTFSNLKLLDDDWFEVVVPEGSDLRITIQGLLGNDIDVSLYDSNQTLVVEAVTASQQETVYSANLSAGLYYIYVNYWSSDLQNVYNLTVEMGPDLGIGTVTGLVSESSSANLIPGIYVRLYNTDGLWMYRTLTDENGLYSFDLLPGAYTVRFDPAPGRESEGTNHLAEWYNDHIYNTQADEFVVVAGQVTANIDGFLEPGGILSGHITDPYGSPVENAQVYTFNRNGNAVNGITTDATGFYFIERLRTGNYCVRVRPRIDEYAVEWYRDKTTFEFADSVHVDAGFESSGIDIQLNESGYISGRVTDSQGSGISDVTVGAYDISGVFLISRSTDENGYYTLPQLPKAEVKVYFNPNFEGSNYVSEWNADKETAETADPVSVQSGQTTVNIDAQLETGGSISGRVTDPSGSGLFNILVIVFPTNSNEIFRYAYTGEAGNYTIERIPQGPAKVFYRPHVEDLAVEWYGDATSWADAEAINVMANQTANNIDAELARNAGFITGRVIDSGGVGIENVRVSIYEKDRGNHYSWAYTDSDGYYSAPNLPTSEVIVYFNTENRDVGYISEYFDDQPSIETTTPVSTNIGKTTGNIDAVLGERPPLTILSTSLPNGEEGVPYSTTLEAEGGTPIYNWSLLGTLPDGLTLDSGGTIHGIPTTQGTYNFDVSVTDCSSPPNPVIQNLSIDIAAYNGPGLVISGHVTLDDAPLSGVTIAVSPGTPTTTDGNGFYETVVSYDWTGTITPSLTGFEFNPEFSNFSNITSNQDNQDFTGILIGGESEDAFEENDIKEDAAPIFLDQTYGDLRLIDDDWYKLTIPQLNTGEILKIAITGILDNNINLAVFDMTGHILCEAVSSSQIESIYLSDLPAGDYLIKVTYTWDSGLQNIYSLSTEISDSFETGSISGLVTNEGGTEGLSILVRILDMYGYLQWQGESDIAGNYRFTLPPNNYYVFFRTAPTMHFEGLSYIPKYYNDANSFYEAELITVQSGPSTILETTELEQAGSISGYIIDSNGNDSGAQILAYDDQQKVVASVSNIESGFYTLYGIPEGNYKIRYRPWDESAVQWYPGKNSYSEALPIAVQPGVETTEINVIFEEGGILEGQVTDTFGNPISNVRVRAYDESSFYLGMGTFWTANTDGNGFYAIHRLPTGNIKLWFDTRYADGNYVGTCYGNTNRLVDATLIPVVKGQSFSGYDVELEEAGTITGRVTDNQGDGLFEIVVWPMLPGDPFIRYGYTLTDEEGYYTLNRAPQNLKIRFRPYYGNYATEWFDNKPSYADGDIVFVSPGQTLSDVNAEISENGGTISGRITDSSDIGIEHIRVYAYDETVRGMISQGFTDENGDFTVGRLPTCNTKLYFDADYTRTNFYSEYYFDSNTYEDAFPVAVIEDQDTGGINVILSERTPLNIVTSTLSSGTVAQPFNAVIEAEGGREFYHFSLPYRPLPPGLYLESDGTIRGTPTTVGTFTFNVEVIDTSTVQQSDSRELTITIAAYSGTDWLISGTVTADSTPLGGVVLDGLPGNPISNASGEYIVPVHSGWSGTVTPTLAGYTFNPTERSYNDVNEHISGQNFEAYYSRYLWIVTDSLPDGIKGESYGPVTLEANGGWETYTWEHVAGTMPNGMTIDSNGDILGTPSEAEDFTFTVKVTDSAPAPHSAYKILHLHINAAHEGTWTSSFPPGGQIYPQTLVLDPVDPNLLWAGANWRGIYKRDTSGGLWENQTDLVFESDFDRTDTRVFLRRYIPSGTDEHILVSHGQVYMSFDDGATWEYRSNGIEGGSVYTLVGHPTDPNVLFAATYGSGLNRTDDAGLNWTEVGTGLPALETPSISFDSQTSPTCLYIGGYYSGLYKSTDTSGENWSQLTDIGLDTTILDIEPVPGSPSIVYVAGYDDTNGKSIYKSSDSGSTWVRLDVDPNFHWESRSQLAIDPGNTSVIYAASWERVWKSTDSGATWNPIEVPIAMSHLVNIVLDPNSGVDPLTDRTLYAGTETEGIIRSQDSGVTWSYYRNGMDARNFPHSSSHSLKIDTESPHNLYAGARGGGFRSDDSGATWSRMDIDGHTWDINSIAIDPLNQSTIHIFFSSLYKSANYGQDGSWTPYSGPYNFNYGDIVVAPSDPNILYLSSNEGNETSDGIYKSTDYGDSWDPINNDLGNVNIHTLAVRPDDPDYVIAGTLWGGDQEIDYGLFLTTDGGSSWSHISSGLPDFFCPNQIVFAPSNPDIVYMVAECQNGGIYKSDNGGYDWYKLLDENANAVGVSHTNPDIVYLGTWNTGGFYTSLNGGASWTPFNDGLPPNPGIETIAVDPTNHFHVYIGTTAGVFETNIVFDLMITTESLPQGVKNELYGAILEATGGTPPYSFDIVSGSLPNGISQQTPGSGEITGTPTLPGTWDFTVRVTDDGGLSYTKDMSIHVLNTYSLTTNVVPVSGGSITKDPDTPVHTEGDYVALDITENAGYTFVGWSGDASGKDTHVDVQMTRDKSLTANFALTISLPDYTIDSTNLATLVSAASGDIIGGLVNISVSNLGDDSYAGDVSVGVYLSTDNVITTGDILLWNGRTTVTAPTGGTTSVPLNPQMQIPTTVSTGDYFIGVMVDEFDAIAEQNELNNSTFASISITSTAYQELEYLGMWAGGASVGLAFDEARNLTLVGHGPLLQILDVSDPANPVKRSELHLSPSSISDIKIVGNYAYVAAGADGLFVVDLTDAENPVIAGSNDSPYLARGVVVTGNYAYVTDHINQGLRVFDISTPSNPIEVETAFLLYPGRTRGIVLSGNYIYVTASVWMDQGERGVRIIDITVPDAPVQVEFYGIERGLGWPEVSGDFLFIPTRNELHVVDISVPDVPVEATIYHFEGSSGWIKVVGDLAYLEDNGRNAVVILNVSDPQNIHEVGAHYFDGPFAINNLDVTSNFCYANGWMHSLKILDVANPENPYEIGEYEDYEGIHNDFDIANGYAYVTSQKSGGASRFKVMDISDPADINVLGVYETSENIFKVRISANFAYLLTYDNDLIVLDISNPLDPIEASIPVDLDYVSDLEISGNFVYVIDRDYGLMVFDISTPSSPTLVAGLQISNSAYTLALSGNYAYIGSTWEGLRIIDISDPFNPFEVGTYWEENIRIFEVAVSGNYAYLEDRDANIVILDVTNPTDPQFVSSTATNNYGFYGITASGSIVYISTIWNGVMLYDVSDPTSPVFLDEKPTFIDMAVIVKEDFIYVLDRDTGLLVYRFLRQ